MFYFKKICASLLFLTLVISTECGRKPKRNKNAQALLPRYEQHPTDKLPSDVQINTFLYKGESKRFYYFSTINNAPLSATITSCSSRVHWTFELLQNHTEQNNSITTEDMYTLHVTALQGQYRLSIKALENDTFVHIYMSTEPGGPQALQNRSRELKLSKRQRKKFIVKWEPSLVDPQKTDYCLTVSAERHYASLCSAKAERYGISAPPHQSISASQILTAWQEKKENKPLIVCVGSQTHFTLRDLIQGQSYYFNLFAINQQSNLTYPYGSAFTIFDKRVKALSLKDGKISPANLKKLDGKAVYRFKVGRKVNGTLKIFVIPCGGAVDVEVSVQNKIVAIQRKIVGFTQMLIPNPQEMTRYYIKIFEANHDELGRTSSVEVLATTKSSSAIPIPNMPHELTVKEYVTLRKCDSITVGWLALPEQQVGHYCLVIKEARLKEMESFKLPNQCGLDNRLKKSADFLAKYCRDIRHNKQALTQKIGQLKPGKNYIIQVTVGKLRGKTLSYNLLQVRTKSTCQRAKKGANSR